MINNNKHKIYFYIIIYHMKTLKESILSSSSAGKTQLIRNWIENNTEFPSKVFIYNDKISGDIDFVDNVTTIPSYIEFDKRIKLTLIPLELFDINKEKFRNSSFGVIDFNTANKADIDIDLNLAPIQKSNIGSSNNDRWNNIAEVYFIGNSSGSGSVASIKKLNIHLDAKYKKDTRIMIYFHYCNFDINDLKNIYLEKTNAECCLKFSNVKPLDNLDERKDLYKFFNIFKNINSRTLKLYYNSDKAKNTFIYKDFRGNLWKGTDSTDMKIIEK
jgi:hypothetical protein